jgi:hypothetical protein
VQRPSEHFERFQSIRRSVDDPSGDPLSRLVESSVSPRDRREPASEGDSRKLISDELESVTGEITHLNVHQNTIDSTRFSLVEHVDSFLTIASEKNFAHSLFDELTFEDSSIDLIVLDIQ